MHTQSRTMRSRTLATLALTMVLAAPAVAGSGHAYVHPVQSFHAHHGYGHGHPHDMQGMSSSCPYMNSGVARAPAKTLGVMVSSLPNAALDERGLGYAILVSKVQSDSAAAQAGIRSGDLIIEFDGKPVFSGERLRWLVNRAETGKAVEIKLLRDKETITLNVTPQQVVAPVKQELPNEYRKMGRQT